MSHVLPNISQGRFFEPIFTSKKFDLYMSIYGIYFVLKCLNPQAKGNERGTGQKDIKNKEDYAFFSNAS